MNEFTQRWRTLTQAAQASDAVTSEAAAPMPYGFVTRVLAGHRAAVAAAATEGDSWDDVFISLGRRATWLAVALCLVTGGVAFTELAAWYQTRIECPVVEHSLTEEASTLTWL
jgi:hypothetical protein